MSVDPQKGYVKYIDKPSIFPYIGIIIFLVCLVYSIYFTARQLVKVETLSNKKSIGLPFTFLLILFFPLGIWNIQPRIAEIDERDKLSGIFDL